MDAKVWVWKDTYGNTYLMFTSTNGAVHTWYVPTSDRTYRRLVLEGVPIYQGS